MSPKRRFPSVSASACPVTYGPSACPQCGFVAEGVRCPRCFALKVKGCDGGCSGCGAKASGGVSDAGEGCCG